MALTGGKILSHTGQCDTRTVHVPKWADETGDDAVIVRGMTIREYELNQAKAGEGESTAWAMARCILADESGARAFTDADVGQLAELPMADVQDINKAIVELSGLGVDDAKNSESPTATTGENGDSSSDSPASSDDQSTS